MGDTKDVQEKVELSDSKSLVSKLQSSHRAKIAVIVVLVAFLLLGVMVSMSVYFSLKKTTPSRLAEVNLEEGETLTYRVDQNIEIEGSDSQKATISAIVGIQVLNKTSEEYWFLMKFNLSHVSGNAGVRDFKIMTYYFLVCLQVTSRAAPHKNNKTTESFEVYGPRLTNTELLRQVYGILEQLLPVLKSDLYEDVDGEKVTGSNPLEPEESPLLPGSVKMHREANTSDKDTVLIKKHFDRTDFVSLSSDIDLDLKYSDSAFINKSNGMVTQSRAYLSEQLNFGEPIHDKSGSEVTAMKINLTIKVSLIELSNYFEKEESERVSVHYFVQLVLPKSKATFSVNEPSRTFSADTVLNSTPEPSVIPSPNQQHNKTNSSDISLKRSRRALRRLNFYKQFTVFEKKMIGINVKGKVEFWVYQDSEMGIRFRLIIGSRTLSPLISKRYPWSQLEDGRNVAITLINREASITISIPVFFLRVGVEFSLKLKADIKKSFPSGGYSLNPRKLTVELEPYAEATTSISAYVSAWVIRAGVYGDGTLVRVGLPVTLSFNDNRASKWCVDLSTRLTALELSAGIFYQWRCFSFWRGFYWCSRRTLMTFGTWAAFRRNWHVLSRCA